MSDPHLLSQTDPTYRHKGYIYIVITLLFGVGDTVLFKVISGTKVNNFNFNHPLFLVMIMFAGMSLGLVVRGLKSMTEDKVLTAGHRKREWRDYKIFIFTSLMDLIGMTLTIIALM